MGLQYISGYPAALETIRRLDDDDGADGAKWLAFKENARSQAGCDQTWARLPFAPLRSVLHRREIYARQLTRCYSLMKVGCRS
jgi:hypothetical protein